MAARRIGILTGGGDVPGLNSVIKSVVYNATEIGCEVIGIRRGWEGLTHMRRAERSTRAAAGRRLHPTARSHEHADDRPHRRHDAAHVAHEPVAHDAAADCRAHLTPTEPRSYQTARTCTT